MKYLLLTLLVVLQGCSTTVPVAAKFPDKPSQLVSTACPNLQKLTEDAKLSDVSKTVTVNYTAYYECAVKVDAWIEWYQIQKNIFERVGK